LASFFANQVGFRGGVRVALADANDDGVLDLFTTAGPGGMSQVRAFDVATGEQLQGFLASFMAYETFAGGVFVSGDVFAPASPLRAVGTPQGAIQTDRLALDRLDSIRAAALSYWESTGLGAERMNLLGGARLRIADLPGELLGAVVDNAIVLDEKAAGFGWFVDPTPLTDEEFEWNHESNYGVGRSGEAGDRFDLLTVLKHEYGHLLGLDDRNSPDDPYDLMASELAAGIRRR
jgi:hypothetical protein